MKNKLKTGLLIFFVLIAAFSCTAQDTTKTEGKIKEYVLTLSNLSPLNVGIRYKKQLRDKMFFKVGLMNLNAGFSSSKPLPQVPVSANYCDFSAGFELGLEFRRGLNNKFAFFHGPNVSFSSSSRFVKYPNDPGKKIITQHTTISYGIPYTLGILLHLKGHFFMSAEIAPGIFMNYSRDQSGRESYSPSLGFGNTFSLVSLVYRR